MHRCNRRKDVLMSVKINLCSKGEHIKVVYRITVLSFYFFQLRNLFIL